MSQIEDTAKPNSLFVYEPREVVLSASASPSEKAESVVYGESRPAVGHILEEAARCFHELGEGFRDLSVQAAALQERLASGRFHLAVLGQFKRGKSTLLNALLGTSLLPTAVVPLTALPTFIRNGSHPAVRVSFLDERPPQRVDVHDAAGIAEVLAGFVTETGNPKNRLGVAQVDVFFPAPLLERGLSLIDTPGIGSTHRHNTEATLNFLPQCDAALFLISADPPITEVEVEFLREVRSKIARLFFILNKVDYLDEAERRSALEFLHRVLTEQAGVPVEAPIFCVSARQGLQARARKDEALWRTSGMAEVESHLVTFLTKEKTVALQAAVAQRGIDALEEALLRLRLRKQSLRMPLDDLQCRLAQFELKIEEAQRQRIAAGDLLAGDHRRMHDFLEEHVAQLRTQARHYLNGVVEEMIARDGAVGSDDIRAALAEAIPAHFERQSGKSTELFRIRMAETLRPHQRRADELIESVRKAAAALFEIPYRAPDSAEAFEVTREPYWVTHKWSGALDTVSDGIAEWIWPKGLRQRRLRRQWDERIESLVIANVENLRWSLFQSIDQTFRRYRSDLEERLARTVEATQGAIRTAMERRTRESAGVAGETAFLTEAEEKVETLRARLAIVLSDRQKGA